jgi:hypothetical protein
MNLSRRFAGASGVVFVLLSVVIGVSAPPIPTLATSGPDVVTYFSKNQGGFLIGNYLGAAALIPGIIVVLYVTIAIRDAEPGRGYVWLIALVTNTTSIAAAITAFALLQAAAVVAPSSPPQLALAITDAGLMSFGLFFLPQAAGVASLAWGFLLTGTMPRAIGWAGVPVAAVMLVASVGTIVRTEPLAAGGLATVAGIGLFFIWFLAISAVLLAPPRRSTTRAAESTP